MGIPRYISNTEDLQRGHQLKVSGCCDNDKLIGETPMTWSEMHTGYEWSEKYECLACGNVYWAHNGT